MGAPVYSRRAESRTEPSGPVFAMITMNPAAWTSLPDKSITCHGDELVDDLGVHTNHSCIAAADLGVYAHWYPGVNYVVWRGNGDRHCHVCKLLGDSSTWSFSDEVGAFSYINLIGKRVEHVGNDAVQQDETDVDDRALFDEDEDGKDGARDFEASGNSWEFQPETSMIYGRCHSPTNCDKDVHLIGRFDDLQSCQRAVNTTEISVKSYTYQHNLTSLGDYAGTCFVISSVGFNPHAQHNSDSGRAPGPEQLPGGKFVFKSWNLGRNWTWTRLPNSLQGLSDFRVDPTDNTTLYGFSSNCLTHSQDQGDTWAPCWQADGLTGKFTDLVIKDSSTMLLLRSNDVPLRSRDGGTSWGGVGSCQKIAHAQQHAEYSWTGKTLVLHGFDGGALARGEYGGYVWVSENDGDTWRDETGDLVTMSIGAGQWFGNRFYMNTGGQGIQAKVLEEVDVTTVV